jgi:hypothetical protein
MTPPAAAAAPAVRRASSAAPAPARPRTTAPRPRRVSGPARQGRPRTQTQRTAQAEGGLALGALAALRSIERHPLLDRLIGGRTWIALVAFALIGIVTLQLGLLQLNAGIGRTLEQESSLRLANSALSIENSELAAGDRVEASAARLGMELVPIGALRSLTPRPRLDAVRAAAALSTQVREVGPTAASAESSTSSTASATAEQTASAAGAQQPSEARTSATGESSSGESPPSSGESSPTASAPSSSAGAPVTASQPSAGSAGSISASEATPAGGVQAGPTG